MDSGSPPLVIRPARPDDLGRVMALIAYRGHGLTSLPRDPAVMLRRLHASWDAVRGVSDPVGGHKLLLVLEEPIAGLVVGITGIAPRVGTERPTWNFRLDRVERRAPSLDLVTNRSILRLSDEITGCSEVGSLMLHPEWRGGGNGGLLSRCRYLFVAAHRAWFAATTVAQMRGISDAHGRSPFWDAVGAHFFPLTFVEADLLSGIGRDAWVPELMPREPIYVDLLPEAARDAIGRVHPHTEPARHLLEAEGFHASPWIDLFDGGAVLTCATDAIATVAGHRRCRLIAGTPGPEASATLVATGSGTGFRCLRAPVTVHDDEAVIAPAHLTALGGASGSEARIAPPRRQAAAA